MANRNKYIIWPYIISLTMFLGGIVAAIYLVHNLRPSKPVEEAAASKNSKDTTYVKLLNPGFAETALADTVRRKNATTSLTIPPVKIETPTYSTSGKLKLPRQTGRWLLPNNPNSIDIKSISDGATDNLNITYASKRLTSIYVGFGIIAGLFLMLLTFFSREESLENATVTDIDPEDLQELFNQFKPQIAQLRNPRKILRFKNMVKYHYYFLKKGGLNNTENLRKMMWILIGIQDDPSLTSIEKVSSESLGDSRWFYDRIKDKDWFSKAAINPSKDDALLMTILKLNVDMGV
ncbi:hypothetical protein [Pinibacter soli]|uniref:Uncharacterized protein n=1 Tax=Pinibacter soli TaxID=3044211 RepID=A0ABT6RC95_9BACT|nr:hypothetical protein [Pinibacter soli]MDI3320186.1 hypothetical protein [Pinibacter soli]